MRLILRFESMNNIIELSPGLSSHQFVLVLKDMIQSSIECVRHVAVNVELARIGDLLCSGSSGLDDSELEGVAVAKV